MHPARSCPPLAVLLAIACATPAAAADVTRDFLSHGPANCQSALPVFDGLIRKRPKAVANEGTGTAFVTCDFENLPNPEFRVTAVQIYLLNRSDATVSVGCTLVQGFGDEVISVNLTRSDEIAPGETDSMTWTPADNDGMNLNVPSLSCAIPAGTEIYGTRLEYLEEIGS